MSLHGSERFSERTNKGAGSTKELGPAGIH